MSLSNKIRRICTTTSLFLFIIGICSCAQQQVARPGTYKEVGLASWYGPGFYGRRTASGERFTSRKLTAAHRKLPFGTHVKVTNLNNRRSVVVRINDRGPFRRGRVIDLSKAAAKRLGLLRSGVTKVKVELYKGSGEKDV